jgi:glucose/arabinose dehydrogenase
MPLKSASFLAAAVLAAFISAVLPGCSSQGREPHPPPHQEEDGGTPPRPDAGTPDAGPPDAGTPDAGTPDTGTPDAGNPDASSPFGMDVRPSNPTCRPIPSSSPSPSRFYVLRAFPHLTFSQPAAVLQAPGDAARVFVMQRGGAIRVFANDESVTTASNFLDITPRVDSSSSEGLLGMAFHPQWPTRPEVFLFYTGFSTTSGIVRLIISRFSSTDGGATLDPSSEESVLSIEPFGSLPGGGLAFGPDGYLYIGVGTNSSQAMLSQDLSSLNGKFLRIDVDGASPYTIPDTNPFRNGGGRPEIYAWGFSNPRRWSFDRATGELWAGDANSSGFQEVDRVILGGNYGYPIRKANECFQPPRGCDNTGLIEPVVQYLIDTNSPIVGGYVYRGAAIPFLAGRYLYAEHGHGKYLSCGRAGNPRYSWRVSAPPTVSICGFS